jgi:predicted small lipoprotein YifL
MRSVSPALPFRIVVGAAIAALVLTGCGRKGGLDPPPANSYVDPAVAPVAAPEQIGPDGRPVAPQPQQPPKRWTPIDWLID